MRQFFYFCLILGFGLSLSACRQRELTPAEKILGTWEIANVPEVQKYHQRSIKMARMKFMDDGIVQMSLDTVAANMETGTWQISEDGNLINLKADAKRFNDPVPMLFEDDFTIWMMNDGVIYQFKKIES